MFKMSEDLETVPSSKVEGEEPTCDDDGDNVANVANVATFKVPVLLPIIPNKVAPPSNPLNTETEATQEKEDSEKLVAADSVNTSNTLNTSNTVAKEESEDNVVSRAKTKDRAVVTPYKEPAWSGLADVPYNLEVLKGGVIVDNVSLNDKPFYLIGRLKVCDVVLEHPSISRFHACVQYRVNGSDESPPGFYLYDMNSTHGTCLNKQPVQARCYYRLRVGYMIKFGGSSRVFILQGPEEDQEAESELTVTELKEMRKKQEAALAEREKAENGEGDEEVEASESSGIDWGMGEDADEETDMRENPFALESAAPNEDLYIDDPKKTLRGWFEREGYDLEYDVEEKGFSQFTCRIKLPLDSLLGEPVVAEATVKGKKKEAVAACALEACRVLDRHGVLRQATHESRKRKQKNWEECDYYDSDEDTFLDRTGTIEKKRQQRITRSGKDEKTVETYDTLTVKLNTVTEEIARVESEINANKKTTDVDDSLNEVDELDAYMTSIQNQSKLSKCSISALKLQLSQLKQEETRLQMLVNIAKPAGLPEIKNSLNLSGQSGLQANKTLQKFLPSVGTMKGYKKNKVAEKKDDKEQPKKEIVVSSETKKKVEELLSADNKVEKMDQMDQVDHAEQMDAVHSEKKENNNNVEKETPAKNKAASSEKPKPKAKKRSRPTNFEYDASNPDYAMWMPPSDQSGDGITKLNERFGY